MKGLRVSIYRNAELPDASNGGISSRATVAVLVGDGISGPWTPRMGDAVLKVCRQRAGTDTEYIYAVPVLDERPAGVGPMFGGNFAYSSDSRFRDLCPYPIPIHDRFETQEQYDANSD